MSEINEYEVIDAFWGLLLRFPSLPRRQQTVKFKSIYKLKKQLLKDAVSGKMRKVYRLEATPQNITFAAENFLDECVNGFCNTDVAEMKVNYGKISATTMILEFEIIKWKN